MNKHILISKVLINFFNRKDRKDLYRHIVVMIRKNLQKEYKHLLSKDKINIISNIITIKTVNGLYSVYSTDHVSLLISINLNSNDYRTICIADESDMYELLKLKKKRVKKYEKQ